MAFEVPPLPYAFDALEPNIDATTMQIHHDKHHAAYVANANKALEAHPELASKSVEDLLWGINDVPEDIRTVIRNNAGGHSNHSIFWTIMGPGAGGNPTGRIADAIKNTFGGYDAFKEQISKAAVGQFGSGWAWLVTDRQGKLSVRGCCHGTAAASAGRARSSGVRPASSRVAPRPGCRPGGRPARGSGRRRK